MNAPKETSLGNAMQLYFECYFYIGEKVQADNLRKIGRGLSQLWLIPGIFLGSTQMEAGCE